MDGKKLALAASLSASALFSGTARAQTSPYARGPAVRLGSSVQILAPAVTPSTQGQRSHRGASVTSPTTGFSVPGLNSKAAYDFVPSVTFTERQTASSSFTPAPTSTQTGSNPVAASVITDFGGCVINDQFASRMRRGQLPASAAAGDELTQRLGVGMDRFSTSWQQDKSKGATVSLHISNGQMSTSLNVNSGLGGMLNAGVGYATGVAADAVGATNSSGGVAGCAREATAPLAKRLINNIPR